MPLLLWSTKVNSYVIYQMVPLAMTSSDPSSRFQRHRVTYS